MPENPLLTLKQLFDDMTSQITSEMTKQFRTTLRGVPIEIVNVEPLLGNIQINKEDTTLSLALIFYLRVKDKEALQTIER